MCVICLLIDKEKLNSFDAQKALYTGEIPMTIEHSLELIEKIDNLKKIENDQP